MAYILGSDAEFSKKGGSILAKVHPPTHFITKKLKKRFKTPNHTKQLASLANNTYFIKQILNILFCYNFNNSSVQCHTHPYYMFTYICTIWKIIFVLNNFLLTIYNIFYYSMNIIGHFRNEKPFNVEPKLWSLELIFSKWIRTTI